MRRNRHAVLEQIGPGPRFPVPQPGISSHPRPPDERDDRSTLIRVLLVDDHPVVVEGLQMAFARTTDIRLAALAVEAKQAVRLETALKPDMILLDLRLASQNRLDLVLGLKAFASEEKIVIWTDLDSDETIAQCTDFGIRGYVLKNRPLREVTDAIRRVHAGGSYFCSDVLAKIGNRLGRPRLSGREMQVLRLAASGRSNCEIAMTLLLTERTARFHLGNAYRKLNVRSRCEAVWAWHQAGYC